MEYSEISKSIFKANYIGEDKIVDFVKALRLALRLDYEVATATLKKMTKNDIVEKWYEFNSLPENRVGGS